MSITQTQDIEASLLASLLADESFWPAEPKTLDEVGLTSTYIEQLALKHLSVIGTASGRGLADSLCLPFGVLESLLAGMRTRQWLVYGGSAPFNDYYYTLTEEGRKHARAAMQASNYVGPAPVPLEDYIVSVEAQSISAECPRREALQQAMADISVDEQLFDALGPAVNSSAGMFLYGPPGNGKSTLARRITICFGQEMWVPHALVEDGQIIKYFDGAYHQIVERPGKSLIKAAEHDRRWVKIRRPTVVVGGELTMDNLEVRHDANTNICEAPLQLKSNGGCLLIDDFGRQRINPDELLNRWIIPLEARHDFLTLPTGKKIQVPFEQLIIFSTNLEPKDLVDEAFLRRIPYKIEIGNPSEQEFQSLFRLYAQQFRCEYRAEVVDDLIKRHYRGQNRPMRRCHPRDLLFQVRNYCAYNGRPIEMRPEYFDRAVQTYFADVLGK